ncbi:hypothetical protein ABVV53_14550 [Novosphingobium sp. RD2P27]|uniref:Uncharacterized protein n=1 Tax=Novosphingobium kalidii TaxID=3230299 RepID=A0ABV2D455_9SPHN
MFLSLTFALAACGGEQTSADRVADKLDEAAEQSGPVAAEVIEERADQLRERETAAPVGQPGSYAQDTMRKAGAAAVQGEVPSEP